MLRFRAICKLSLAGLVTSGVYAALVRHFSEYALACMARIDHQALQDVNPV